MLGGTGPAGSAFALRYADLGHRVTIGSRDSKRAQTLVASLTATHSQLEGRLVGADNASAASADIVVVATPWEGTEDVIDSVVEYLRGKIVVTMVNALYKRQKTLSSLILPRGSVAEHLSSMLPSSKVVGAFHHAPAKELGNISEPLDLDVLVCSDDGAACDEVVELANEIPGTRGICAGSLSSAQAIEAMTAVLINVNVKYKTRSSLKLSGLKV